MNALLRERILELAEEDQRVRAKLTADGSLFEGYHPRMEEVHRRNAAALTAIIDEHGWPGRSLVGEDGAHAAWLILQHAIGDPAFQRRGLELLRHAVANGEAPPVQAAMLDDRIRMFEGRPQIYGTQFDWDRDGQISTHPIENIATVDERRRAVGLGPLDEEIKRRHERMARSNELPPANWLQRQRDFKRWARSVGWQK